MIKHIDRWLSFTRRLELGIEMEDIILVTGCHRTRSWASVVFFEDQEDTQVSFGVEVAAVSGPNTNINWQFSPDHSGGAVVNWGPDGRVCNYAICRTNRTEMTLSFSCAYQNLPEDQCIFIRGFRVARPFRFLPRHLVAAAEPSSDSDEHNPEPDVELTSIPTASKV